MKGLLLAGLLTAGAAWSGSNYIVDTAPGVAIGPLASKYRFTVIKSTADSAGTLYSVDSATPLSNADVRNLNAEPGVHHAEANATVASTETDTGSKAKQTLQALGNLLSTRVAVPYYGNSVLSTYVSQPGMDMIELSAAQRWFGTGSGTVAIIDTGVDLQHPALRGALVQGYDFTRNRADTVSELNDLTKPMASALQQSTVELLDAKRYVVALQQSTVEILDQSTVELLDGAGLPSAFGHGTMVAGLVHLVAPGAKIMPLKAFLADGSASLYDIASAIRYAADNGANVISMSFAYSANSAILMDAIAYAKGKGVICVASAGNDGKDTYVYPADCPYVIGVGSVNFSDRRSPFSNYGHAAGTSAPGEALVTIYPGGNYAAVWGTSFSSALVAGGVTLMRGVRPKLAYGDLSDILETGVPIDQDMGDSRLDLLKSLIYLATHHGD